MSNKLYNRNFIKVSREHYKQLQLLVGWLTLKAGGKLELPTVQQMIEDVADTDTVIIPDVITGGAAVILRKVENGPAS